VEGCRRILIGSKIFSFGEGTEKPTASYSHKHCLLSRLARQQLLLVST